jgi:UDP-2-acetamido-2,6-beta-L-arabino-hexul-4-ose reductase
MAGMNSRNPDTRVVIAGEQGFIARNLVLHCQENPAVALLSGVGDLPVNAPPASGTTIFYVFDDAALVTATASCRLDPEVKHTEIAELAGTDAQVVILAAAAHQQQWPAGDNVHVIELGKVFGKWACQDSSNTIGMACKLVRQGNEQDLDFPDTENVVYIDDLCRMLMSGLGSHPYAPRLPPPRYEITAQQLVNILVQIRESRRTQIVPAVGDGLTRALYATYISYLGREEFSYALENHSDQRGSFIEFLKTEKYGQVSCLTAVPGVTRGQHYHHSKCERFLVLQGQAQFAFRNLLTDEACVVSVSADNPAVVETIPGWVHNIKNVGEEELIVVLWANELFNPELPDTRQAEI